MGSDHALDDRWARKCLKSDGGDMARHKKIERRRELDRKRRRRRKRLKLRAKGPSGG